ncbi:CBS domain-containing protein [Parelusimicrobium proximum]|uniref:sugar phosphate nucleotidyltransferase n=1 Tax=Parelusimicrobium proximum TaxID=3228953 RepID=UPI003D16430A
MKNFKNHLISENKTILDALGRINNLRDSLTLFVTDSKGRVKGALTDGDIRRGLLKGHSVNDPVKLVAKKDFYYIDENRKNIVSEIRHIRQKTSANLLPVINKEGKITGMLDFRRRKNILPVGAVIMAGGRGERLRPLTDKLPKPLIKVGKKAIVERNIDRLISAGISDITMSVNYLADKIIAYFKANPKEADIKYVREKEPLGTFGSLRLIKKFKHDYLLVMNSDLFTSIDFENFFLTFMSRGADMAVATVPYNVDIPYGIMETGGGDSIKSFKEKPTYTHYANAGIYIIKTSLLKKYLPAKGRADATDFISSLTKDGKKVISYPIVGYWVDIGRPEDLRKVETFAAHISEEV